ncbi:MAG: signal peptidase I [Planctomycetota bacterium]
MAETSDKARREMRVVRDTVESIWVAIVLAFVLRAFMFEAFVIPTGSMAPRLVGEHWDLRCPSCGWSYSYGLDKAGHGMPGRDRRVLPVGARCPNCGYPFAADASRLKYLNGGDRVLVLKYPYEFRAPRAWDVVVFRNPQNNQENYIKRLVGLPGEAIEIIHGDVFVRRGADYNDDGVIGPRDFDEPRAAVESPWRIRRKKRSEVRDALWQIVYDNDYRPDAELIERYNRQHRPGARVRPPKWVGEEPWNLTAENGRRFEYPGGGPARVRLDADRSVFGVRYGYNPPDAERRTTAVRQEEIASDLKLSLTFRPHDPTARLRMSLSGMYVPHDDAERRRFRSSGAPFEQAFEALVCADGRVALRRRIGPDLPDSRWTTLAEGRVDPLKPGRGYDLRLSHLDYQVTLWFEGRSVLRTTDAQYAPHPAAIKRHLGRMREALPNNGLPEQRVQRICQRWVPTPRVEMIADGGGCSLTHVRLHRDVYYTAQKLAPPSKGDDDILTRYGRRLRKHGYLAIDEDAPGWGVSGNPIYLHDRPDDDLDEFYVLGDNSPQSLDGRAWTAAAPTLKLWRKGGRILPSFQRGAEPVYTLGTVPRYNLTGRAMFVYWPSGFRIPGLPGLPVIPNVGKMRLVR